MTAADFSRNRDNFCYRHPDRVSFVMCQRCLRTICPECQTPAAVGVVCPECMKQQQQTRTPAQKKADRRWGRGAATMSPRQTTNPVTFWIIGITAVVFVLQFIIQPLTGWLMYNPLLANEAWRIVTVALVHSTGSLFHFALNMLSLWMIGRVLEPLIGSRRFLALYVLSTIGGSAAVTLLAPTTSVIGASGAIFGLMGALLVIARRLGSDVTGMLVVLGINLVLGFTLSGVSWQAHVGGLIVGVLVGWIYSRTRNPSQQTIQIVYLVGLGIVLVGLCFVTYVRLVVGV